MKSEAQIPQALLTQSPRLSRSPRTPRSDFPFFPHRDSAQLRLFPSLYSSLCHKLWFAPGAIRCERITADLVLEEAKSSSGNNTKTVRHTRCDSLSIQYWRIETKTAFDFDKFYASRSELSFAPCHLSAPKWILTRSNLNRPKPF